jgi:branched-chain amino acid transport system substrate-binding protein
MNRAATHTIRFLEQDMLFYLRVALSFLCLLAMPFAAQSASPLHVGVTVSMSGKYAEMGAMKEKAYRLWEDDINRKGGLLGRPVKLSMLDDQSDPQRAAKLYENLIVQDKADFVLGPYSSEITQAVAQVTEHYHYPLLASGASADTLWQQGRKYLFGVYVSSSGYTTGFLELLVQSGINKIAIVSADDLFSKNIEEGTREWAKRYRLDVLSSATFKKSSAEIEQGIVAARAAGAQALIIAGHFDDAVNGQRALKKIGWTPKAYYATVGPAIQNYVDTLKGDADYAYASSQWEPTLPFPGAREFTAAFKERHHILPSYHAACAYAAGQILEAAVRKTKSLDRLKLRDTLASLDTMTIIGRYGVDRDGRQVRHFTSTVQWQRGKREIVAPPELATAKPIWR